MPPKPDLSGTGADLYLVQHGGAKCVRRALKKSTCGRTLAQQAEFEGNVLSYLSGQPFSTRFVSSDAHSVTYEYIVGRELFYSADGKLVGAALASLHSFSRHAPPIFSPYLPAGKWIESSLAKGMEGVEGNAKLDQKIKKIALAEAKSARAALEKIIAGMPEKSAGKGSQPAGKDRQPASQAIRSLSGCLVHNDLAMRNILIDEGKRARLIDWSWALHSDGILDLLSYTCPIVTSWEYELFISDAQQKALLDSYFEGIGATNWEKGKFLADFSSLAIPYFASMLCWVFSEFAASGVEPKALERFSNSGFLRRASDAAKKISKRAGDMAK